LAIFASKLAPTETLGNKKPDIIIGLELARQAGNSVFPASDIHPGAVRLSLA